jgi:MFS family permease
MPLRKRFVVLLALVVVTAAPMAFAPNIGVLALVLLLAGLAVSPSLITGLALVEFLVPPARPTEGMVIETTGAALGITAGSGGLGVAYRPIRGAPGISGPSGRKCVGALDGAARFPLATCGGFG